MSQHDYVIANQAGSLFRSDLNSVLSAIVTNNSGASEPSDRFAYMFWADTTEGWMKQRNSANTEWVKVFKLSNAAGSRVPVRTASGVSSLTLGDAGSLVRFTGTSSFGLPNVSSAGNGFWFAYKVETGVATIDPASTQQINGATTAAITANDEGFVYCDGSAWRLVRGFTERPNLVTLDVASLAALQGLTVAGTASLAVLSCPRIETIVDHTVLMVASGTVATFESIPSWVKEIDITFQNLSTSASTIPLVQLGDSGGLETTGYKGTISNQQGDASGYSTGSGAIMMSGGGASFAFSGRVTIKKHQGNVWLIESTLAHVGGTTNQQYFFGEKELSSTLTQVAILAGGASSWDSGSFSANYRG